MAIIGKIRQRSGLVIGFIAVSLLLFVVSDALNSGGSMFGNREFVVGEMGGKKIKYEEFDAKLKMAVENTRKQFGGDLSPEIMEMIQTQIWEGFVRDNVLDKHFKNLHIEISPEELTYVEFQAPVPHQLMANQLTDRTTGQPLQQFANPQTGQLDLSKVLNYRQSLEAESDDEKNWVAGMDEPIIADLTSTKYFTYIRKANYTTTLEAEEEFAAANNSLKGKITQLNYSTISDSAIKVTPAEMEEYLQKHKEEFKQEASRTVEYVVFDILPSAKDTVAALKWITEKTEAFKNAKNDSTFAVNNGTNYDSSYVKRGSFPDNAEDSIFSAEKGKVIGPFYDKGVYATYKIIDTKTDTVVFVRGAQILIRAEGVTKEDTAKARVKAAEIIAEIKGGKTFDEAVKQYSLDPTTNTKGGDMGWLDKTTLIHPKNVMNALSNGRIGEYSIVTTAQGIHIIKVTHAPTSRSVWAVAINRPIEPSGETQKYIQSQATQFAGISSSEEAFNKGIEEKKLSKRFAENVGENDRALGGVNDARNVVMWAFDEKTKVGDFSQPFPVSGNTKIVVARLAKAKEKGTAKMEDVKEKLEEKVRKEKKAEQLRQKFEQAMQGATTIDQVASKAGSTPLDISFQTFGGSTVMNVGQAPRLLGYMFGAPQKKIIGPIKDEAGVYVFWVEGIDVAKLPEKLNDMKAQINGRVTGGIDVQTNDAIKKLADIKDYRYKFF